MTAQVIRLRPPAPTPPQRAAAEALLAELRFQLEAAAWMERPAPAGFETLENVR
jgi:hypothetical protein